MQTAVVAAQHGLCGFFEALELPADRWVLLEAGVVKAVEIEQQQWHKRAEWSAVTTAAHLGRALKKMLRR